MSVVESMKEVADLVKRFNDIELNRRILNLENEVLDLSREKRRAEERVEELERALKFRGELKFKAPFYYADGDATPYCPGCWEAKRMAIHVTQHQQFMHLRQCPACKHSYDPSSF